MDPSVQDSQVDGGQVDESTSELLASALKKMDGLLGRYASNDEHEMCRYVCEYTITPDPV